MKSDDGDFKKIIGIAVFGYGIVIFIWLTLLYVAWHFVAKFW